MIETATLTAPSETSDILEYAPTPGAADTFDIPMDIVAAFRDGDHRAFEAIYNFCAEAIRSFFRMVLRNDALAEELCQELFVRIWENRRQINPALNFKSYIRISAKSLAMNHLRHKQVADKYTNFRLNMDLQPGNAPDEQLIASELQLLVALTLDQMPEQRRRVFEMSRGENLSNSEISVLLGISESTVRVHLHKALKELSGLL